MKSHSYDQLRLLHLILLYVVNGLISELVLSFLKKDVCP